MISFPSASQLSRLALILILLFGLQGCVQNLQSWNPAGWFEGSLADDDADTKGIRPGYGDGPLAAPKASPAAPVQAAAVAPAAPGGARISVAILLPLSGNNAALGQAMLNAAQMAVFDVGAANFNLMPFDTAKSAGASGGALGAARDAVAAGAQLVIGPVFSSEIAAVRSVTAPVGLSMLSLSTDTTQAAPGTYVMGFAPAAQVGRVVHFAADHGKRRFAALVPANAYGNLVAGALQSSVTRAGGTVIMVETYNPDKRDSAQHVQTLALAKQQIDALLLPLGGGELALVAGQLATAGFDTRTTQLLGSGLWDEPDLARGQSFLVGGWYAAPDVTTRKMFVDNYKTTYGQEPPRLSTLAYDATALAATLAKRGARFYDTTLLTNPSGFAGLDGIFRLEADGTVERGLAINQVEAGGVRVIDAAPSQF